jgi:hypothetical protein
LIHGLKLRGLDDATRAEAPRAHANPLVAAVDDRPDCLEVRLESTRAHVVGVAMLTSDDRLFPAHLAALGHKST